METAVSRGPKKLQKASTLERPLIGVFEHESRYEDEGGKKDPLNDARNGLLVISQT